MFRTSRHARSLGIAIVIVSLTVLAGSARAAGGDVQVGSVTPGGDLSINGDTGNNDITVTQNADGTVTITGNNGTTVNGQPSVTTSNPVTGELKIKTRAGDDTVTVDGVTVDDLTVDDQMGTNGVTVKNSKVKDKLKVKNGDGTITIEDSSWGRRDIRPGAGSVNPANLSGKGGAGSVGTPPSGGGGGDESSQTGGAPTLPQTPMGTVVMPDVPKIPHAKMPAASKGGGPKGSHSKGGYKK